MRVLLLLAVVLATLPLADATVEARDCVVQNGGDIAINLRHCVPRLPVECAFHPVCDELRGLLA